jgi:hypothetical protein
MGDRLEALDASSRGDKPFYYSLALLPLVGKEATFVSSDNFGAYERTNFGLQSVAAASHGKDCIRLQLPGFDGISPNVSIDARQTLLM